MSSTLVSPPAPVSITLVTGSDPAAYLRFKVLLQSAGTIDLIEANLTGPH